jgi:hypothetical protein
MPQFYKFLSVDLRHHDFTYKEGLNVDHVPFNPCGSCRRGGLYYTSFEFLHQWYNVGDWPLIADVTVPDDARVYKEPCGTKWKADRLVLSNIRPLRQFFSELDEAAVCRLVARCGWMLEYASTQTDAMCMAAVMQTGGALRYVQNQTDALCLAAVKRDGLALEYVRNQTEAICLAAVQKNGCALRWVKDQTRDICRAAIAQNNGAKFYVKIPIDF